MPKGVMVTHKAICSQLLECHDKFAITNQDRILHSVAPNFDIAIWELFGPFISGSAWIAAKQS